jgi:formylglycine-generating enzyme
MRAHVVVAVFVLYLAAVAVARADVFNMPDGQTSLVLVPVGDTGNVADPLTGYGAVSYPYWIGKYDVTMAQYAQFLNAVATAGDPYGLYNPKMLGGTAGIVKTSNSSGLTYIAKDYGKNMPIVFVSWGDAARFVNWLANGQPIGAEGPGTTETGTYAINGGTSDSALIAVTRSATATWVLPTRDEWYKCAYYSGGGMSSTYWLYPTQSNDVPSNVLSPTGTNNASFFNFSTGGHSDPVNLLTPVGTFLASHGEYGTYDMGGDVWQWEETAILGFDREARGGSYADISVNLMSPTNGGGPPSSVVSNQGFRVAYVPEPSSIALLLAGAVGLWAWRWRRGW